MFGDLLLHAMQAAQPIGQGCQQQRGQDGAPGAVRLASGKPFQAAGRQPIPAGDSLIVETPGGGGYGDPRHRAAEHVAEDIRRGLVTPAAALRDYGVALEDA